MCKHLLLSPVPMMAVLLTIYPITVQFLLMEQPRSYFIGDSDSRKVGCRNKRQGNASRQTFNAELTKTRTWLQERRVTFNDDAKLTQLYNTNLFFCMFFSTGITLDTEELVLVTSRSPRYYVSAAYWDRDSLLWSFPAILDADPERAKEMLSYVFGRQRRNFGIHSRYIDGTVLEPGFELDELVAPLLALERYINKTGEKSILNDSDIVQGISLILESVCGSMKPHLADCMIPSCSQQTMNTFTLILHTIMCLFGKHLKIWPNSRPNMHILKKLPVRLRMPS